MNITPFQTVILTVIKMQPQITFEKLHNTLELSNEMQLDKGWLKKQLNELEEMAQIIWQQDENKISLI